MASRNNVRGQRVSHQTLSTALSSAAAEWLLMLLLFLDGLFSYLVTKFARHSKLQNPCLFCSRLDHVLGQERPGFYKDLICRAHKLEISSLAFCHVHEKLANVQDMCEDCLLSFATEKKSNSETYRSLVGKLERNLVTGENAHLKLPAITDPNGLEVKFQGEDGVRVPLLKKDHMLDSPRTRYCSCCHAPFSKKSHVQRLLQTKSIGTDGLELDVALVGQAGLDYLHRGDRSSKRREKSSASPASSHIENHSFGPLSHIGYTELKVTSDSESEVPPSDDDDGSAPVDADDLKGGMLSQSLKEEHSVDLENQHVLSKNHLDKVAPEKPIYTDTILPEPSSLLPVEQIHPIEHCDGDCLVPKSTIEHGLEELSWNEFKLKDQTSPTTKLISEMPDSNLGESEVRYVDCVATIEGHDNPPVPDRVISEVSNMKAEVGIDDSTLVSSAINMEEPKNLNPAETESKEMQTTNVPGSLTHNHMDLNDACKLAIDYRMNQPSPRDSYRVHEDLKLLMSQISAARGLEVPWNDMTPSPRMRGQSGDSAVVSSATNTEPKNLNSTETESRQMQSANDPGSLMHNHMDLNDAYKLAISCRMNQPSPRDSYRVHEDLKLLLSQISGTRGFELPWSDITPSPRVHGQGDDLKMSDSPSTTSQQNLYKRFSIERNESGFESLDGSIVSEIEGESPLDRLKRQIELDRKSMSLLYKELEEERNASAIAANQAMAMITRLQEEKAAMQMEALQYQRMMEEQAEYDQEALQTSNDLLVQREEELQDLKAEIESYKKWSGDESLPTKMSGDVQQKEDSPVDRPLVKPSDSKKLLERSDTVFLDADGDKGATLKNSMLDFDDEKVYISECLKSLEKKLLLFSNNGVYVDVSRPYASQDVPPLHALGNGHLDEKDIAEINNSEQGHWQEMAPQGSQSGEDAFLNQKESSFDGEDSHLTGVSTAKANDNGISELPKFEGENQQSSMISRTTNLVDIGNEVLHLNYRLEALEADRSFLECTANSLRNGNDGIQLVQEIASHLRELRRIGVRRREQAFT